MQWIIGLLIILLGTSAGAAGVFFLRERSVKLEKILLGFAAGVMTAASIWSLLLPAIDGAESWGKLAFVPAAGGFAIGFVVLMWLNRVLPEPEFLQHSILDRKIMKVSVRPSATRYGCQWFSPW